MDVSAKDIERIVERVLDELEDGSAPLKSSGSSSYSTGASGSSGAAMTSGASGSSGAAITSMASRTSGLSSSFNKELEGLGVFSDMNVAVREAGKAQNALVKLSLECRDKIIENIRKRLLERVSDLASLSVRETGLGRVEDKAEKIALSIKKTPGLEDLETKAFTGDHGLSILERSPFGVIGAITPSTNPSETVINNGIGMVAAGNAVAFNPHPSAKEVSKLALITINEAVVEAGGPPNLLATVKNPTLDSSRQLMHHGDVQLLVVTGGGAVVKAAFASGKKVIAAGPGNPPVVVDETADLKKAAKYIVDGASFDNNVLCIAEKEIICVNSVADELIRLMKANGAYQVIGGNIARLERLVLPEGKLARPFVGKDVQLILSEIGINLGPEFRLAIVDVDKDHPFVHKEMLMPVVPLVRVPDVDSAIELAVRAEQGNLHSAMMHSLNIENLHKMARAVATTIFVKNGPSYAGLGAGGEGYTTYTIAGPTGEGLTTARTFTRQRRCVLKDYFRIV